MSDGSLERAKAAFEKWYPGVNADDCKWIAVDIKRDPYGGIKNREVSVPIAPPPPPWPIQVEDMAERVPFRQEVVTLREVGNNLWMGYLPATDWNRAIVFFGYA
jgi:hypothetical protein